MIHDDLANLSDPNGLLNPYAVASHIGLDLIGLADLVRMHRNSLYRLPHGPGVQERLSEIVRILVRAGALMDKDSQRRAVVWFRNQPITGLGGLTAMELVKVGRAEDVRTHLFQLEEGGYA